MYKIQLKSKKLLQDRTRPETDANILIIPPCSKQLEDLGVSIQELKEQKQYLKQLEEKEKATKEAIMSKTRFQESMKLDEGIGAAAMSGFSFRVLGGSASLLRRELRIRGCIGDPSQKDKLSYISVKHQINEVRKQRYADSEIINSSIRAMQHSLILYFGSKILTC